MAASVAASAAGAGAVAADAAMIREMSGMLDS
jgi:hypothetical protein